MEYSDYVISGKGNRKRTHCLEAVVGQVLGWALYSFINLFKKFLSAYSDEYWGCNEEHLGHDGSCPKKGNSLKNEAGSNQWRKQPEQYKRTWSSLRQEWVVWKSLP